MLRPLRQILVFAGALFSAISFAAAQQPDAWISRFTAKHVIGSGVGHEDGFTSLEWFLPLDQDATTEMWFGDFRGIAFNDAEFGGNAGMGKRWYFDSQDRIYGINGYWDFRNEQGRLFNQAGLGFESLGQIFDFRVNGYTPTVNDTQQRLPFTFSGNNLFLNELHGLSGLDYEAAANLPPWGPFQARIAGGGYYFDSSNTDEAAGWRARAELAFRDEFAASFVAQDDDMFGATYNLVLEWRPKIEHFDALARRSMRHRFRNEDGQGDGRTVLHRLADPVYRQQNIVLKQTASTVNDSGGTPLVFVHAVPGGAGTGTFEDPYGSLAAAAADPLAAGNTVYTPEGGTFTENVVLQDGTLLLSNGSVRQVTTGIGNVTLPFSGTGTNTILNGTLTVANDNTVDGFDITGSLVGNGVSNSTISSSSVLGTVGDAVSFTNSTGIVLSSITAEAPAGNAVIFTASDAQLSNVTVTSASGAGIVLNDSAATIADSSISDTGDDGIQVTTAAVDRVVSVTDTTVTDATNEGVDIDVAGAGNLTFTASGISVTATNNALDVATSGAGDAIISLTDTTLNSTTGTGLNVDGSGGAGTLFVSALSNTNVTGAAAGGLVFDTVTFDADSSTVPFEQVVSGSTTVGSSSSRVTGDGVSLTSVSGDWNAGALSIFNQTGVGLKAVTSPLLISSEAGSEVNTEGNAVLVLDSVESELNFDSLISTNAPGHAFRIEDVAGSIVSQSSVFSESILESIYYENIALPDTLDVELGTTTINSTIDDVEANNIQKVGDVSGLTEDYSPLTINGP